MAVEHPPLPSSSASQLHSSSSHRLPTVSASAAIQHLSSDTRSRTFSTGLAQLDCLLVGALNGEGAQGDGALMQSVKDGKKCAGVERGTILEIWGPAGSGKSTFA